MKRYLFFGWETYYPSGGWEDFRGDAEDIDLAVRWAEEYTAEDEDRNAQVVDTESKLRLYFGRIANRKSELM